MVGVWRAVVTSGVAVLALAGCTLSASPATPHSSSTSLSALPSSPGTGPSTAAPTASTPTTGTTPPTIPDGTPSDVPSGSSPDPQGGTGTPDPVSPSAAVAPPENGLVPVVTHVPTTDPVVFITIDDGYTKDPRLIDLLRARQVPVTPFLTVDAVRVNPGYFTTVEQVTGQSVQDHTLTHPHLTRLTPEAQAREICGAADALGKDYGRRPWLFRPPYGAYDRATQLAAGRCGMTALVLWDVSMPHRVLRFAAGDHLRPGDIILVHWRPGLYRDLPVVLDAAAAAGLRIAALQDYLPAP